MSTIPIVSASTAGEVLPWQSITASDQFANNGRVLVIFRNSGADDTQVVFDSPARINGLDIENPTVVIEGGEYQVAGPFDPWIFNTAAGVTIMTCSGDGLLDTDVVAVSL